MADEVLVEKRITYLESTVARLTETVERLERRRQIKSLPNKPTFRNKVLEWINTFAQETPRTAMDVATALRADEKAVQAALAALAKDHFIERVHQGKYLAYAE